MTAPQATDPVAEVREQFIAAVDIELGRRCPRCLRLVATDDDWERYGEGEGDHLCWDRGACGVVTGTTIGEVIADSPAIAAALAAERAAAVERITADVLGLAEELEQAAVESKRRAAATVWLNEYESAVAHSLEAAAARLRAVVADTGKPDTSSEEETA